VLDNLPEPSITYRLPGKKKELSQTPSNTEIAASQQQGSKQRKHPTKQPP
jgi:hypothetical protein